MILSITSSLVFGGKYLIDRVVKVDFEAGSVQCEFKGNSLEPFREKSFSATVNS